MDTTLAPTTEMSISGDDDYVWPFQTNDDISNMHVFQAEDDDDDGIQDKYGIKFEAPFFCSFIIFGAIVVFCLVRCSKRQERAKQDRQIEQRREPFEKLKLNLEAKPYAPENSKEALDAAVDTDVTDSSGSTSPKAVVEVCDYNVDEEEGYSKTFHDDGTQCMICKHSFALGQPVYQSNNPLCRHHQHQACMDKWLEYQNTCPTCNQPFIVQPPTHDA